jgi:hypothetical protein
MNAKILIAAVAALSLAGANSADAYHGKRHRMVRHHAPAFVYMQPAPTAYPGPRPVWAAPGSCYTDEGYGRYRPCDAGPSGGSR